VIRNFFRRLADVQKDVSIATRLRLERIVLFKKFISDIPKPRRILDVGGEEMFWVKMGFAGDKHNEITLLNLSEVETHYPNLESVVGDARNMCEFRDCEFDVVFSNSVIEHVGGYEDQKGMAKEAQRIGKRYFIQTPNFYFPFEPHYLFPFFQFFPLWLKVLIIRNLSLGWINRIPDKERAIKAVNSIRLLRKYELKEMFPNATILEERIFGFPYSFVVYERLRDKRLSGLT
jgi:hypothetical protein